MKIVGFILNKNNSKLLKTALNRVPDCIDEVFISDDNSTDDSEKTASLLNLKFFKNRYLSGYGGNVKNALYICFNDYEADYAVEIHGDGAQFHPDATIDAIKLINLEQPDLICGSRFIYFRENLKLGYPLIRMIPNLILSTIERILLKIPLSDFHQGFKIYSQKFFNNIDLEKLSDNYLLSFEVIIHSKMKNLKIKEVPVLCDYKAPHTSHKLFGKNSAFSYQLETFKVIYNYFNNIL